jgi:hypothetical protein
MRGGPAATAWRVMCALRHEVRNCSAWWVEVMDANDRVVLVLPF